MRYRKTFSWVVGVSGVGKACFVRELEKSAELRTLMKLPHQFKKCSMKPPGRPVRLNVNANAILRCAKGEAHTLIKWQSKPRGVMMQVVRRTPWVKHRILHLVRPYGEIQPELEARDNRWKTEAELEDEAADVRAAIDEAAGWCDVAVVNASGHRYVVDEYCEATVGLLARCTACARHSLCAARSA